jgi:hypothetical protein
MKIYFKAKSKTWFKILTLVGIFSVVVAAYFIFPHIAKAGSAGFLEIAVFKIFVWFAKVEAAFMDFLTKGLIVFMSYRAYFNEDFVRTGWGVLRDLVNLSFILVLMIIALMSILRVEESVVRKLLPRFVFAVLLVNFSFFFCRVVIDFSDGLSLGFLPAIQGLGSAIFSYVKTFEAFELSQVTASTNIVGALITGNPFDAVQINLADGAITGAMTNVILLGILVVAVLVATISMGVRIVALCILIILSPLAFLALILPSTAGLASKWMKSLFSYAMWGPASVFFIWLSVITFTSDQSPISEAMRGLGTTVIPGNVTTAGTLLKFLVVAIFLYVAIISGKLLGNTGADLGMKMVKGGAKLAGKGLGLLGGTAAGAVGLRGFGKGLKGAYDDMIKQQQEVGKSRAKDLIEGIKTGNGGKLAAAFGPAGKYNKKVKAKEAADRLKKHKESAKNMQQPDFMQRWGELRNDNSADAMEEKQAMVEVAAEKGLLNNDMMFGEKGHQADASGERGIFGSLNSLGFDQEEAKKIAARVSSISRTSDSGDKRYVGIADYVKNAATGKEEYVKNSAEEYTKAVSESMGKIVNKGVIESKKVGAKTFDTGKNGENIESAMAAVAGIDKQVDSFSGKEISYSAMFNQGAHDKMKSNEHKQAVKDVRAFFKANPTFASGKDDQVITIPVTTAGGVRNVKMTAGRAKQYVASVARANRP